MENAGDDWICAREEGGTACAASVEDVGAIGLDRRVESADVSYGVIAFGGQAMVEPRFSSSASALGG